MDTKVDGRICMHAYGSSLCDGRLWYIRQVCSCVKVPTDSTHTIFFYLCFKCKLKYVKMIMFKSIYMSHRLACLVSKI